MKKFFSLRLTAGLALLILISVAVGGLSSCAKTRDMPVALTAPTGAGETAPKRVCVGPWVEKMGGGQASQITYEGNLLPNACWREAKVDGDIDWALVTSSYPEKVIIVPVEKQLVIAYSNLGAFSGCWLSEDEYWQLKDSPKTLVAKWDPSLSSASELIGPAPSLDRSSKHQR